jgi:hypothetical protein
MKNKSILLAACAAIFFNFLQIPASAQSVDWLWAKNDGGAGDASQASSVAVDSKGNVLVTGYFSGSSITFGTNTLTNVSPGSYDVYVVKYNAAGTVLWAKSAGSTGSDYGLAVTTDASDNVYISGYFKGTSITFGTYTLTNGDSPFGDTFLAKYDQNGNVLMAINDVSSGSSNAMNSMSTTAHALYSSGTFQAASETFGSKTLTNANSPNVCPYLVKFNQSGTAIWAIAPTGNTASDEAISVSTDAMGNVFLAGYFLSSSITFGTTTLTNTSSGSYQNVYLVKFDSNGNVVWAKNAGGTDGDDFGLCVSADGSGNAYLSGDFKSSTITFGSNVLTNTAHASSYSTTFLAKYDASGNVSWAFTPGGTIVSNAMGSISADAKGVYGVGASQASSLQFGTLTLSNPNATNQMPYLARFDASGNPLWISNPTGNTSLLNNCVSVTSDHIGNVSIAGYFASSSLTFGSTPAITNSGTGTNDMYAAHAYDSTVTEGINEISAPNGIRVYPNPFYTSTVLEIEGNQWQQGNTVCTLYDVLGRSVLSLAVHAAKTTINRNNLPTGMYFYQVKADSRILATGKLIIQ